MLSIFSERACKSTIRSSASQSASSVRDSTRMDAMRKRWTGTLRISTIAMSTSDFCMLYQLYSYMMASFCIPGQRVSTVATKFEQLATAPSSWSHSSMSGCLLACR